MMTYFEIARSVRDFQYLVGWLMIIQPGTWYDDTIIDCAWRLVGSRLSGASAMQSFTLNLCGLELAKWMKTTNTNKKEARTRSAQSLKSETPHLCSAPSAGSIHDWT